MCIYNLCFSINVTRMHACPSPEGKNFSATNKFILNLSPKIQKYEFLSKILSFSNALCNTAANCRRVIGKPFEWQNSGPSIFGRISINRDTPLTGQRSSFVSFGKRNTVGFPYWLVFDLLSEIL